VLISKTKTCSRCGLDLPRAQFYQSKLKNGRNWTSWACKPCQIKYNVALRRNNKARYRAYDKKSRNSPKRKANKAVMDNLKMAVLEPPPDLQGIGKAERVAYHRGIWVGWQRGIDSHLEHSSLGNILMSIVSLGLQNAKIDDETRRRVYEACARVPIEDYEKQALKS